MKLNHWAEQQYTLKILTLILLLSFLGCSHAYIASWDKQQVTACCPTGKVFCTQDKLYELAKNKCGGKAEAVSGNLVTKGASASYGSSFGNGSATVRDMDDQCIRFNCE